MVRRRDWHGALLRGGRRARLAAVAAMLGTLVVPAAAAAATLTVSSLDDAGTGSLRQALADAAANDTITFGVTGTITLRSGALRVDKDLTINGPGAAALAVSGNRASRVFDVIRGTVLISNLTVRDGLADVGAGIRNAGTLTVSHCTLSGNNTSVASGAGIFNGGVLTVDGCTLRTNNADVSGGGVQNDGSASIQNTLFDRNDADSGGGIFNNGTLTVLSCAFAGNHAFALGGGLRNNSGAVGFVTNVTFSGNDAVAGGGIFNGSTLNVAHSTLAGNTALVGSAIDNSGPLRLTHTIIVGGKPSAASCSLLSGSLTSGGYNLDSRTSCGLTGTGDLTNIDARLGALADNGGPTPTCALLAGSPAVDGGNPSACSAAAGAPLLLDQRGAPRFSDGDGNGTPACDIGAYEALSLVTPDADSDGVRDMADTCPSVSNFDQSDADADGAGDVCDNCASTYNPAQVDTDGNGSGDLCEATAPASLSLTRVRLTADSTGRSRGRISIRGVLDSTTSGGAAQLSTALGDGVTVHITGAGLVVPEVIALPCKNGRSCRATKSSVRFSQRQGGNSFSVSVTASGRSYPPPLATAGTTVTFAVTGADYRGTTSACTVTGRSSQVARCEP